MLDQPGLYQGRYTPVEMGRYEAEAATREASAAFQVTESQVEMSDLRQNLAALREMAAAAGGEYANQPAWKSLAERLPPSTRIEEESRIRFRGEKFWVATTLILFLALEWFIRWRKGLP